MKANELMVGDHIYVKRGYDGHLTVESIKGILQDEKEAYPIKISTGETISFKDIIPIPLTPEILEKNGFRIVFDGELHVSYFQDIESFHTEVKVDKIGIYQKLSMFDGLGNGVTIIECKYIHQLQHAMRMCSIEKEIIL